jgi:hypothetical protein
MREYRMQSKLSVVGLLQFMTHFSHKFHPVRRLRRDWNGTIRQTDSQNARYDREEEEE